MAENKRGAAYGKRSCAGRTPAIALWRAIRGARRIVRPVRGEILAIIGPNGSGKTSTVECLEGLRKPTSGRIAFLGRNPRENRRALYTQVGVQLQETQYPDGIRVQSCAAFLPRYTPAPRMKKNSAALWPGGKGPANGKDPLWRGKAAPVAGLGVAAPSARIDSGRVDGRPGSRSAACHVGRAFAHSRSRDYHPARFPLYGRSRLSCRPPALPL